MLSVNCALLAQPMMIQIHSLHVWHVSLECTLRAAHLDLARRVLLEQRMTTRIHQHLVYPAQAALMFHLLRLAAVMHTFARLVSVTWIAIPLRIVLAVPLVTTSLKANLDLAVHLPVHLGRLMMTRMQTRRVLPAPAVNSSRPVHRAAVLLFRVLQVPLMTIATQLPSVWHVWPELMFLEPVVGLVRRNSAPQVRLMETRIPQLNA
jgi:hypothetical protein